MTMNIPRTVSALILSVFLLGGNAFGQAGRQSSIPLAKTVPFPVPSEARPGTRQHLNHPSVARQVSTAMADAVEKVLPAVVVVKTSATRLQRDFFRSYLTRAQIGQGSGVIIDREGHLLTNRHVLEGAERVRIQLVDGREFEADFIAANAQTDIAVLKIRAPDGTIFTPAEVADSDKVRMGEMCMAIGSPFGLSSTVTHGIVSQTGRGWDQIPLVDFIQTSASINVGNSGGALVDVDGKLIGINTFIQTAPGGGGSVGIGFAIPSNVALRVAKLIIEGKNSDFAWLGVKMGQTQYGVILTSVNENGPAKRGGLRKGDLILEVDGKGISTNDDLRTYMALKRPGDQVRFKVIRSRRDMVEVTVTTSSMPSLESMVK